MLYDLFYLYDPDQMRVGVAVGSLLLSNDMQVYTSKQISSDGPLSINSLAPGWFEWNFSILYVDNFQANFVDW